MRTLVIAAMVGAACLGGAARARGQGNPSNPADFTNNPHPTMPWTGITYPGRIDYGATLRYIPVPPQPVAIETLAPAPEGAPPETVRQVVEIPGYQIVETTTGFYYPERWTLHQLNLGVYQWRRVPGEFRRKF